MYGGSGAVAITARGNRYICPAERRTVSEDRRAERADGHGDPDPDRGKRGGPERTGGEGFVGDGRTKHVTVITREGERHEHGDVSVKHSAEAYLVSPTFEFPDGKTTRYEKTDCERVTVTQHHSSCFITTAAAGEGETLESLRTFRDDALAATPAGRALVAAYERISPPIAATLAAAPEGYTARAVRRLVERCGALARRRRRAGSAASRSRGC